MQERSVLANVGVNFITGSNGEEFLSYKELYERALRGLGYMQHLGIPPKAEVVLQIEDNKSLVIAFWACILGGMIPIPLTIGKKEEHKRKLFNVWKLLDNPYLISTESIVNKINAYALDNGFTEIFQSITKVFIQKEELIKYSEYGEIYDVEGSDIAFIQFSSGSTGIPKGVVLTHTNLLVNIKAIGTEAEYVSEDTMLSWMPLTHDMGLIGFHLCPVFEAMNHLIMDTNLFVRRPSLWLEKATEYKVSILCSPNFGYKYVLKHTKPSSRADLDLSSVRLIYNGAEPISVALCREFLSFFEDTGLKSSTMCPVYGLAEASLAVSISKLEDEIITVEVDRNHLHIGDRLSEPGDPTKAVSLVNVGKSVQECMLRITDDKGKLVPDEVVGHVQIFGRNVTSHYYKRESAAIGDDGWLDTGDLGVLINGSLYITGRAKDIIFVNGQNYYPHDIEHVAQKLAGIELNKIAVTGYFNPDTQENETIAFVFHRGNLSRFLPLENALKAIVNSQIGLELNRIIPVRDIPRTTSGKLQRFKLAQRYMAGDYSEIESKLEQLRLRDTLNHESELKPSDEIAEKLGYIWAKVLGNTDFTSYQKFLEIGGNSLKLAEVGMLIWKEFEVELALELLYEKQTIQSLADEIKQLKKTNYLPIPKAPKQRFYPVSSSQKRLYYAWQIDKQSLAYNNPVAFAINGNINHEKLENAINTLILKNDVLRMSFEFDGSPVFKLCENIKVTIDRAKCRKSEVNSILHSFVMPFDLVNPPIYRFKLLEIEEGGLILFLDFHHIILDGISIYNFVTDLFNLYLGKKVSERPIDFKDFVKWEKEQWDAKKLKNQKDFWLHHFNDEIPVLSLPYDYRRPSIFSTVGKKIEFEIDAATTRGLRKLAKDNSCTLFVLMLSLYQLLLMKYSGQNEVVVGIPVSGRNHADLLDLYGMFVNNIAIKGTIADHDSFVGFLEQNQPHVGEALRNQDYPFEALVNELHARPDTSRNPIFDTMFVYQNMGKPEFHSEGLSFIRYFFDPGFSKFDISLEIFDYESTSLTYSIEYATAIFGEKTIRSFADHFNKLISSILSDPASKISDLQLISDEEYTQFITTFNDTKDDFPQDKSIDQLFETQLNKDPHAIAIVHGDNKLTYEELNEQANELAKILRKNGVSANGVVGILMRKSPDLIISMLGILKAGGCYLPIDVDSPKDRLKHILCDSKSQLLLTTSDQKSKIGQWNDAHFQEIPLQILSIDEQNLLTQRSTEEKFGPRSLHDLAYIIYTSGTTAKPKGVMVEHASLLNYIHWASREYVNGEKSSFPLFTNIAFDLTITSIFTPLATGNSIVIIDDDEQEMAISKVIESAQVNVVKLTPSHLRILKEMKSDAFATNKHIRKFIVGGEAFESDLAKEIHAKFNGEVEIYNEYGPTEATVGCMVHKYDPESSALSVPIGKPISNTQIYVLDKFLKPVPTNVKGELYISGDGLARGYLFQEQLTRQKFISNPFVQGQRMYKTGDLVKRLPSGKLEYMGRLDDQVKINGYRVELSEIASCLKEMEEVDDAIVIKKATNHNQGILVAYYLRDHKVQHDEFEDSTIRNYLVEKLPEYMIPRYFVRLDRFPLTKNGKVDHRALPEPMLNKNYQAPGNEMETILLETWIEIFERADIGIADNFFDLGGDSIKAVQIASRLFERKIEVKARDILKYHTIEQLALQADVVGTNKYEQGIIEGERGLTPIESWFFEQQFANPNYYNQSVLLHFHKPLKVALVSQSLMILVEHHDSLRTNYLPEKRRCFYNNQLLDEAFDVGVYQLNETSQRLENLCQQIRKSMDITSGFLLKAGIFIDGVENYLFLTAHHLIIDGISWRILLEDFYVIYHALEAGNLPSLPPKTASIQLWEKQLLAFANNNSYKDAYWNEVGEVDFIIPPDSDVKENFVKNRKRKTVTFDNELTKFLLTEAHKNYKTDVLTLLTTALALTLKKWISQEQYVVEFENHGRHLEEVDTSRTIGWFTTMYPVKLALQGETLSHHITSIKKQLKSVPQSGIGYGVQKYLQNRQKESKSAVASEIRFNYLGQFGAELNNELFSYSNNYTGEDIDPDNLMTTKLELNLMVINMALSVEVVYSSRAFTDATMDHFCETFHQQMASLLEHIKSEKEIYFSPSDFDAVELDDDLLAALLE